VEGLAKEIPHIKKSKLRREIEALLEQKGLVLETGITAANLDSGETLRFEDYSELQRFLRGRKGRWYITTPGLRSLKNRGDKR
jgi:hypothetical protein